MYPITTSILCKIFRRFGVRSVTLAMRNAARISSLHRIGIAVSRVGIGQFPTTHFDHGSNVLRVHAFDDAGVIAEYETGNYPVQVLR